VKITFEGEIQERCSGCDHYGPHYTGKADVGLAFKCKGCGRLTVWVGGDTERVIAAGEPPVGV
jgi:hypothetical protein